VKVFHDPAVWSQMPFSQITSNINFPPLALPTRGKFRVIVTSLSLKITLGEKTKPFSPLTISVQDIVISLSLKITCP
jgi:hypothetical protein